VSLHGRAEERIIGGFLFPVTNAFFGRHGILGTYARLLRTQYDPEERTRERHYQSVRALLAYAYTYVPYYTRQFARIGFRPEDFKRLEDLRRIPPLTRADLADHALDLVDFRWRRVAEASVKEGRQPGEPRISAQLWGRRLMRNTSSGSTGAPVVFFENGSVSAASWANELRLRSWFGIPPGAREARMARISAQYRRSLKNTLLRRVLWNQLPLPGVSLTETDYAYCCRELARFKPRVLWGFTSALTGLAEFMTSAPKTTDGFTPELVVTWAAPLYAHEQAVLEAAFRCAVTNIYGTRETGHIAARCEQGALHINQESILLETDQASELLATSLIPSPMPFIRYRTGDLGVLSGSLCGCGRSLPVIAELTGRTGEVYLTRDGRMISPNFWCRTFMDPNLGASVRRFQVVYRPGDAIVIRIVRGPGWSQALAEHLRNGILRNLHSGVSVELEYCESIEPQISGKYQMVVNEAGR
jgi:phenylacetate-CoA ligase